MVDDLPPGIGPHEGRELELMLSGRKPLAMFNDDWPDDLESPEAVFAPCVSDGLFIKVEITVASPSGNGRKLRIYLFALPGEELKLRRIIEIQRGFFVENVKTTPELEAEIGRLLGYGEKDIQVFVSRMATAIA
ncbi:MAG: hypothetical protein VW268_09025 [Rhodospirillaceae bacterium]